MYTIKLFSFVLPLAFTLVQAQYTPAVLQSAGFNSTFSLSAAQIKSANLSHTLAESVTNATRFERSQLANGGPLQDDFYTLPPLDNHTGPLSPGTLLKVQSYTNGTPFALPPFTALSRILYTTTDINGTVLPTSAFILWPYKAKQFQVATQESQNSTSRAPVILWTHGTSGYFANAGPSSDRQLWYGDNAPFAMALAGYAVVAPDYAGLGVGKTWYNKTIPHQYLASPASAHDALYAMQASLKAFPNALDSRFTVMGHSQGGGVAWSVAEVLAQKPELGPGYLGSIAGSPVTTAFQGGANLVAPSIGLGLSSIFPDFKLSDWLTPLGVARAELMRDIQGGLAPLFQLFLSGDDIVKPNYTQTYYVDAYRKLADVSGRKFKGPLLVIQGTADAVIFPNFTTKAVHDTCKAFPQGDLEYLMVDGAGHVPSLDASRTVWLQWIADRFSGKTVDQRGCFENNLTSFLPLDRYQKTGISFPQWAGAQEYSYQVPLGV